MRALSHRLDDTKRILLSVDNSLKLLAQISDYDTSTFYKGASLRDLNLIDQDLTGLNFDGADFRGTNLDSVKYDVGAFNNATLEERYTSLVDEFDIHLSDLCEDENNHLFAFVRFRSISLENEIAQARLTYRELSNLAGINPATLRKARNEEVVSLNTASQIARSLLEIRNDAKNQSISFFNHIFVDQPMINMLSLNPDGGFNRLYRSNYLRLLQIIEDTNSLDKGALFKSGPNLLEFIERMNNGFDMYLVNSNGA